MQAVKHASPTLSTPRFGAIGKPQDNALGGVGKHSLRHRTARVGLGFHGLMATSLWELQLVI